MIELGKIQKLKVVKTTDFGVYLGTEQEKVLLPKKQVPEETKLGSEIEVFVYRDSSDRLICTTSDPFITVGEVKKLRAKETTKIGTFLDMGLERDLLLPYKEHTARVSDGEEVLVAMYIDKSSRLAATMKVYPYLASDSPYEKEDVVHGTVYEIIERFGAFVAVDDCYSGLIPMQDAYGIKVGQEITARVTQVRDDGKLSLDPRKKAYMQMEDDGEKILKVIEEYAGVLPYSDKATPEIIKRDFNMSKNAFKRAVGHLYKEGKVEIFEKCIRIVKEDK